MWKKPSFQLDIERIFINVIDSSWHAMISTPTVPIDILIIMCQSVRIAGGPLSRIEAAEFVMMHHQLFAVYAFKSTVLRKRNAVRNSLHANCAGEVERYTSLGTLSRIPSRYLSIEKYWCRARSLILIE